MYLLWLNKKQISLGNGNFFEIYDTMSYPFLNDPNDIIVILMSICFWGIIVLRGSEFMKAYAKFGKCKSPMLRKLLHIFLK